MISPCIDCGGSRKSNAKSGICFHCSQIRNAHRPKSEKGLANINASASLRKGEMHPNWRGNKVSYTGLHQWVRRTLEKPETCDDCKLNEPVEVANISHKYLRDLSDWLWLCRTCHVERDKWVRKNEIAATDGDGRWNPKFNHPAVMQAIGL